MRNKKILLFSICFMLFINSIGLGIILPIMPDLFINSKSGLILYKTYFLRETLYSLCLAIFPLSSIFGMPILGAMSDMHGRSKIILYALGALVFAYLLSVVAVLIHSVWLFLFSRSLTGFLCGTYSVTNALISDMYDNDQERMSGFKLSVLVSVLGFIMSPGLSIFASEIRINNPLIIPFIIAFLLSTINLIIYWSNFKYIKLNQNNSPNDTRNRTDINKTKKISFIIKLKLKEIFFLLGYSFNNQSTKMLALSNLLFQFGFGLFLQSLPLYLSLDYSFTPSNIALFYLVTGASMTISMYTLQKITTRYISYQNQLKLGLVSLSIILIIEPIWGKFISEQLQTDYIYLVWTRTIIFYILLPFATLGFTNLFVNSVSRNDQGKIMGASGQISSLSFFLSGIMIGKMITYYDLLLLIVGVLFFISYIMLRKFSVKNFVEESSATEQFSEIRNIVF